MLRSILVGLDGSPYSQAAVSLGLTWAQRFNCQLGAIGIIDEASLTSPESTPIGGGAYKKELDESRVEESTRYIEQVLSQFAIDCSNVSVSCKVHEKIGDPGKTIIHECQRYDLILLGQQHYASFEHKKLSSGTLEHVLRNTPRPVVAVPETPRPGSGALIAYDGSVQAARTLQTFLASGLHTLMDVTILSIDTHDAVQAAKIADLANTFLGFHDVKSKVKAIVSSAPAGEIILQESELLGSELVVMGCYGSSRLKEFFVGSTTTQVLHNIDLPVYLFH